MPFHLALLHSKRGMPFGGELSRYSDNHSVAADNAGHIQPLLVHNCSTSGANSATQVVNAQLLTTKCDHIARISQSNAVPSASEAPKTISDRNPASLGFKTEKFVLLIRPTHVLYAKAIASP